MTHGEHHQRRQRQQHHSRQRQDQGQGEGYSGSNHAGGQNAGHGGRGRGGGGRGRGGGGRGGRGRRGGRGGRSGRGGRGGPGGRGGRGGQGGSERRYRDHPPIDRARQPHRQLFDRVTHGPSKVLRSQVEANNFLDAIKDHDEPYKLLYDLDRDHGHMLLRSTTAHLDPMDDNQSQFLTAHLLPVLRRFSGAEFGVPALEPQLSGVTCAISEAPRLFRLLGSHVRQPPMFFSGEERKQQLEVLSWFLIRLATARRTRGEAAQLQAKPEVQELVDALCGLDLPFTDFLRGHMAEPESRGNISLDALQDDSLVPFRDILITPTVSDLQQKAPGGLPQPPFHESCDTLVNGQFRLLREALLGPAREELRRAPEGRQAFRTLFDVKPVGVHASPYRAAITFSFKLHQNHSCLRKSKNQRVEFWERTQLLQRGSLVLLLQGGTPVHLAEVAIRDPKELAEKSVVHLSLVSNDAVAAVLRELAHRAQRGARYTMVMVAPNFFAFEPVLRRLQRITHLPFKEELLGQCPAPEQRVSPFWTGDAQLAATRLAAEFTLNISQGAAVKHAMENRVALVQGPPGTGKTFIGVVLAKLLLRTCKARLLLCCYTNHALDQFLTELLDHGVTEKIVRIGGRCKEERLQEYCLHNLRRGKANWSRAQQSRYHELKDEREKLQRRVKSLGGAVSMKMGHKWWDRTIEPFLREHYRDAHAALTVSSQGPGFNVVGRNGKAIGDSYLWERWYNGDDAGVFQQKRQDNMFWQMDKGARRALFSTWEEEIRGPQRDDLAELMRHMEAITCEIDELRRVDQKGSLDDAEVIACTTWGAARYNDLLQQQSLPVVMVEEAGEVLEAHLLTALPRECRHLILIGDHQQLRPKVDHYPLTREAGRGHDLNVSLFERLADTLPYATLNVQHRMRPEFSCLVRGLFYPELKDHTSAFGRESVRGLQHNLVVVHHEHLEAAAQKKMADHQSHSNEHEVDMVKATVRYLLQQSYLPEKIVVLTPYLGQLLELRTALADVADEVGVAMDERDIADARRAGAELDTSVYHKAVGTQKTIRVATIDNFQGEEADLIVVSLVRSNTEGDIGFLKEPERVNVMLSRARLGMILFGNISTFTKAYNLDAQSMWTKLMQELVPRGCVKDGLPVCCQQHPEEKHVLCTPADFEKHATDGGCHRKCAKVLPCGHACPLRCHSTEHKHASIKCTFEVRAKCEEGKHVQTWLCHKTMPPCDQCTETKRLQERLRKAQEQREQQRSERDDIMQRERLKIKVQHAEKMAELEKKDADEEYRAQKEELEALVTKELQELEQRKAKEEAQAEKKYLASLQMYEGALHRIRKQQAQRARDVEQELQQRRAELAHKEEEAKREAMQREEADQQRLQETLEQEQQRLVQLQARLRQTEAEREEELQGLSQRIIREERRKQQRVQADLRRLRFERKAKVERLEGDREAVVNAEHECCICFDTKAVIEGVLCGKEEHFVCDECFDHHVMIIATRDERLALGAQVKCPGVGCESAAYDQRQVAEHVSSQTFEQLRKLVQELAEIEISREADRRVEEEVERRLAMSELEREVQRHRRHVVDEIFNLACPRCKAVFADFDGCFALSCQQCNCHFCAWCLRDCGRDAHRCAAQCGERHGAGGYYGSREQFNNHHRQRRQKRLDEYLATIRDEAVRAELMEACRKDAADLGLRLPAPPAAARRHGQQEGVEAAERQGQLGAPVPARNAHLDPYQEDIDLQLAMALQRAL